MIGLSRFLLLLLSGSVTATNTSSLNSCLSVGSRFDGQTLRILPLGASITFGLQSFSGNGYRDYLREKLVSNGARVNMVGNVEHGPMGDNQNEGHPGAVISEVAGNATKDIHFQPNVVLIHVGTNDVALNRDLPNAAYRISEMVKMLIDEIPGTAVIVSNLIPNLNATKEGRIQILNPQIEAMVKQNASTGEHVFFVDTHTQVTQNMINRLDGTHPTDYGYNVMSEVWYQGIQEVFAKCWINPPNSVSGVNDSDTAGIPRVCDLKNLQLAGQTQDGYGVNDGNYNYAGEPHSVQFSYGRETSDSYLNISKFEWADVNGDGFDDFLWYDNQANLPHVQFNNPNSNAGFSTSPLILQVTINGYSCNGITMFRDIDGDGRADALCIVNDGSLVAWQNTPGANANQPNWISHGTIQTAKGFPASNIRIADIDGDGKLDYLAINSSGNVKAWRSIAPDSFVPQWEDIGEVYNQQVPGTGDINGVQFVDMNGDGRADWTWISNTGQIYISINQRGSQTGWMPLWLSPTQFSAGSSITSRDQIRFGKIFYHDEIDTFPDYMARGLDYSITGQRTSTCRAYISAYYSLTLERNVGGGGARTKGDQVRYCDMRGSGSDDLIYVQKNGSLKFYGNGHGLPNWQIYNDWIYEPGQSLMGNGVVRKDIHLADLDGDGKCDFLIVDKNTSSVHMIQNAYDAATDTFAWKDLGRVSEGFSCKYSNGPGLFDMAVRFADLDGDGKADALCIAPDGTVAGALNKGLNSFHDIGIVRHAQGVERSNIRFADLNGDGRDDLIVLDASSGSITAWYNGGPGSSEAINWQSQGTVVNGGLTRGDCVNFANLNGYGRVDINYVFPGQANADTSYNVCPL